MKKERDYTNKTLVQTDEILGFIADSREPVGLSDVVKATGLKQDAVFRILWNLEELRWVTKVGDRYELGMGISIFWARYTSRLKAQRDSIDRELEELGAED